LAVALKKPGSETLHFAGVGPSVALVPMKPKKGKITAPQIRKIFKDLAVKKGPQGGAAQPGTLATSSGMDHETSCQGAKGCGAKLGT
jgi:hypothetical protein